MAIPAKNTNTLKELVRKTTDKMASLAPKDTGNLRRLIRSSNTYSKVVSGKGINTILTYQYAPQGAEYGKWFNDPPRVVKRTKLKQTAERKGNWQYKDNTFKDNEVKALTIKLAQEMVGNLIIDTIRKELK